MNHMKILTHPNPNTIAAQSMWHIGHGEQSTQGDMASWRGRAIAQDMAAHQAANAIGHHQTIGAPTLACLTAHRHIISCLAHRLQSLAPMTMHAQLLQRCAPQKCL